MTAWLRPEFSDTRSGFVVLKRRVVIGIVPPEQILLVGDGRILRRVIRRLAGWQAGDHGVEMWTQKEREGEAMPSDRRQGAMWGRLEATVSPTIHHIARIYREGAGNVG